MVPFLRLMQNAISIAPATALNFAAQAEDFPYTSSTQHSATRFRHQIQHLTCPIFPLAGSMMGVGLIVQVELLNINNQTTKISPSNFVWQLALHLIIRSLVLNMALNASVITL
jgi:hypothetical protein